MYWSYNDRPVEDAFHRNYTSKTLKCCNYILLDFAGCGFDFSWDTNSDSDFGTSLIPLSYLKAPKLLNVIGLGYCRWLPRLDLTLLFILISRKGSRLTAHLSFILWWKLIKKPLSEVKAMLTRLLGWPCSCQYECFTYTKSYSNGLDLKFWFSSATLLSPCCCCLLFTVLLDV